MAAAVPSMQLRLPLRMHGGNSAAHEDANSASAGAAAAAGHSTRADAAAVMAAALPPPLAPHVRLLLAAEFRRKLAWQSAGQAAQASAYTQRFGRTDTNKSNTEAAAAAVAAAAADVDGAFAEPFLLLPALLRLAPPPSIPLDFRSVSCLWALDRRRAGAATLADVEALVAQVQLILRARRPQPQGPAQARAVLAAVQMRAMYDDMCALDAAAAAAAAAAKAAVPQSVAPPASSPEVLTADSSISAAPGSGVPFVHWFLSLLVNAHPTARFKHVGLGVLFLHRGGVELLWELMRAMLPRPPAAESAANAALAETDADGGGGGAGNNADAGSDGLPAPPAVLVNPAELAPFSPSFAPCSQGLGGAMWGAGLSSFQAFFDLLQRASEAANGDGAGAVAGGASALPLEDPILDHYVPLHTVEALVRMWEGSFKAAMARVGAGARAGAGAAGSGSSQIKTEKQQRRNTHRPMVSSMSRARAIRARSMASSSAATIAGMAFLPDTASTGAGFGGFGFASPPTSPLARAPSFPAMLSPHTHAFMTPRTALPQLGSPTSPLAGVAASRAVPSAVAGSPSPPRAARHLLFPSPSAAAAETMQFPAGSAAPAGSARSSAPGSGHSSERERERERGSARGVGGPSGPGTSHRAAGLQQSLRDIVEESGAAVAASVGHASGSGGSGGLSSAEGDVDEGDVDGAGETDFAADALDATGTATARTHFDAAGGGLHDLYDEDAEAEGEMDDTPTWKPLHEIPAIDFAVRGPVATATSPGEGLTPTSQRPLPVRRHPGVPSLSFAPATSFAGTGTRGGIGGGGGGSSDQPLSGHLGVTPTSWMGGGSGGSGSSSGHGHSSSMPGTAVSQHSLASSTVLTGGTSAGASRAGPESGLSSAAPSLAQTPITSPTGSTYAAHLLALNPRRSTGPTFRAGSPAAGGAATSRHGGSVDFHGGVGTSKTNGLVPSLALHGLSSPSLLHHGGGGGPISPLKPASSAHSRTASGALGSPLAGASSSSLYHSYAYTQRILGMQSQPQGQGQGQQHVLAVGHVHFSTPQRSPSAAGAVPLLSCRSPQGMLTPHAQAQVHAGATFDGPLSSSHAALLSSASKLALRSSLVAGANTVLPPAGGAGAGAGAGGVNGGATPLYSAHHVHDVSLLSERQLRALAAGAAEAAAGDDSDEEDDDEEELDELSFQEEDEEGTVQAGKAVEPAAVIGRPDVAVALQAQFDAHADADATGAPEASAPSLPGTVETSPPAVAIVEPALRPDAASLHPAVHAAPATTVSAPVPPAASVESVSGAAAAEVQKRPKARASKEASASANASANSAGAALVGAGTRSPGQTPKVSAPRLLNTSAAATGAPAATGGSSIANGASSKREAIAIHGPRLSRQSSSASATASSPPSNSSSNAPTPTHKGSPAPVGATFTNAASASVATAGAAVAQKKGVTFRTPSMTKARAGAGAAVPSPPQTSPAPAAAAPRLAPSASAPVVGTAASAAPLLRLPLTMVAPPVAQPNPGATMHGGLPPSLPGPTKPLSVTVDGLSGAATPVAAHAHTATAAAAASGASASSSSCGGSNVHPFGATNSPDSKAESFSAQLSRPWLGKGTAAAAPNSKGQQADASALIVPKRKPMAVGGRDRSPNHAHA